MILVPLTCSPITDCTEQIKSWGKASGAVHCPDLLYVVPRSLLEVTLPRSQMLAQPKPASSDQQKDVQEAQQLIAPALSLL